MFITTNVKDLKINTNIDSLHIKSDPVEAKDRDSICSILKRYLSFYNKLNGNSGVGLAAPQINMHLSAAYIWHNQFELFLVNPIILDAYDTFESREGCLSLPGKEFTIERYENVVVKDDIHKDGIILSGMEAVIAQHEIDHLNGTLISDKKINKTVVSNKIKRNDPCPCRSGLKFKQCCISNTTGFGVKDV